jgi:2-oxoisovalerate dehydrogenase E1 component
MTTVTKKSRKTNVPVDTLKKAFRLMCTAKAMTTLYEANQRVTSKYVHATSRGHEAIQIALGLHLKPQDFVAPYYRDDSILLSIGMQPHELMLQLLAKRDDPFSGGRTYYSHPSLRRDDMPKIPHQSSATGMQAIPTTGIAMGVQYRELMNMDAETDEKPVVVCSIGDAAITEGEVAEALQMAVLKMLPILYLVQDNEWDISASADEIRAMDASEYGKGFKGLEIQSINGSDFIESFTTIEKAVNTIRK